LPGFQGRLMQVIFLPFLSHRDTEANLIFSLCLSDLSLEYLLKKKGEVGCFGLRSKLKTPHTPIKGEGTVSVDENFAS
jgi:hypothetical protein